MTTLGSSVAVSDEFAGFEVQGFAEQVCRDGYAIAGREILGSLLPVEDLESVQRAWDDLPLDTELVGGPRHRHRRYGRLRVAVTETATAFEVLPNAPFRQDGIPLWRGRERVFALAAPDVLLHRGMRALVGFDVRVAAAAAGTASSWDVGLHLIRVVADGDAAGQPTPEGRHRDGHAYIGMHLLRRDGCDGGVSTVHGADGSVFRTTLREPLDSMFVDDARVTHEVSPITAADHRGVRDMLLVDINPTDSATIAG